ncbi:Fatty acid metabolism regulator protein [Aquimixticola soesokkakensis]|uniref:Fatty acid metabolism regulator protein n=1 Tax=Aquimixticola soesokkakensis TaxID=1519096 RepID=A0A1Y5SRS6_9RHOB|nr:TetR/AcrR family transcriptional regulator [Aquimixticola soesokkakensis]SLN43713.1 Fatty acid metabolism regulator protein [Aquimixticola soesokkakensis]
MSDDSAPASAPKSAASPDSGTAPCAGPHNGAPKRRHLAGEDPAKRAQILKGAQKVFMETGFERAAMGEICRAAGVSKGTLYVYFENKEDLFVALVETTRDAFFQGMDAKLCCAGDTETKLRAYGMSLGTLMCTPEVLRAQRIVIGTTERMPDLARRFYDTGARQIQDGLERFLRACCAAGEFEIEDPRLAAYQFIELCSAGLWRRRLFGKDSAPADPETVRKVVDQAVRMMLLTYRR